MFKADQVIRLGGVLHCFKNEETLPAADGVACLWWTLFIIISVNIFNLPKDGDYQCS